MEPANRRTIALGLAAAGLAAASPARAQSGDPTAPPVDLRPPESTRTPSRAAPPPPEPDLFDDPPPPAEPPPQTTTSSPSSSSSTTTTSGAPPPQPGNTYSEDEIVNATSRFFGMGAETVASVVRRIFRDLGNPVGFIEGSEGSAAFAVGLRYGEGRLYLNREPQTTKIFWRGPSIGFDTGANAAKCFTLIYNVTNPSELFQRFPGVEGSAYFIGGIGVNYQRADEITLAPMRAGVGFRLGANIGYLAYSRQRRFLPF